jgi:hypothetical protein
MRPDVQSILERQATWQRSRSSLPWAEKLRLSVAMRSVRKSLRQSCALRQNPPTADLLVSIRRLEEA